MRRALLPLALASSPLAAQDWSGEVGVVTDDRWRGVSLTDLAPGARAGGGVTLGNGLYLDVDLRTRRGVGARGDFEARIAAGWETTPASGLTLDLGATAYAFPDRRRGEAAAFIEPRVGARYTLGPVEARVGAAWAPGQAAIGDRANFALDGALVAAVPGTPVTLVAGVGRQRGGIARREGVTAYAHWHLGADVVAGPATIALRYVDTDRSGAIRGGRGRGGLTAGVIFAF